MRARAIIYSFLACVACGPSPREKEAAEFAARTDSLRSLDAAQELADALSRGDSSFLSVGTDSYDVPGVPLRDSLYPEYTATRMIAGTSDSHADSVGARLQSVATEYAERYNLLLLAELRRRAAQRSAP